MQAALDASPMISWQETKLWKISVALKLYCPEGIDIVLISDSN